MSSILLGPLAQNKASSKLDAVYNSNINQKMNIIEKIQSMQNNSQPEFLNQFDDLRFDNISNPVGVNEAFTTLSGINTSLQRNLDFQRGYSNFQNSDMHYDVVNKEEFVHNNMIPSTSRRDFDINSDRTQRKLETFTGIFEYYTPKKEKHHLFEPMADLTFTTGMPAITEAVQNRFLPSNKNNYGNTPFQTNVRVRPGVDDKNQEGSHSVYRVMPRNIDALRSDINQKVTYESKIIESGKKGNMRGPDPTLTKFKMPDFRETKFNDLLPSKSDIEGPKQTGSFTHVITMRNEKDTYNPGHSVNTNRGNGPDKGKTRFEPSKKENYLNDNTHSVTSIYNKPVMTNTKSFINYENQRTSTNIEYEAPLSGPQSSGGYVVDYKNIPLTTARELMIHNDNILGIKSDQQQSYIFSNDMVLPITKRQMIDTQSILGPSSDIKNSKVYNKDEAKMTSRQSTSHNITMGAVGEVKQGTIYNGDEAKMTSRQSTSHNITMGAVGEVKQGILYNGDEAKMTMRPGTSHNVVTNVVGEVKQGILYNGDEAKMTMRPGTSHNIAINVVGEVKQGTIYNGDQAKITQRPGTSHNIAINVAGEVKQGIIYNGDQAKITQRPGTSHNIAINVVSEVKQGTIYNGDQAKITQRPGTSHNIVSNVVGEVKQGTIYNGDQAKPTIKQSTIMSNYSGSIGKFNNTKHYARDLSDTAKTTHREQTDVTQYIGHANANNIESTYARDLNDKAKTTIREQTESTQHIGHANANNIESTYVRDLNDKAKTTIREQTESTQHIGHANANNIESTYARDLNDKAKTTIREQTESTQHIGHAKSKDRESTYVKDYNDIAKPTIKQTTIVQTPGGRVGNSNMGNYTDLMDNMRTTTKETTMLEDYTGGLHGEIEAPLSHEATNNVCLDDRREISMYNRTPNGKGDLNGPYIDRENVRLNEPILFSYVPHPHKSLDHSVMPTTSRETIEKIYSMSKPVIESSSYYVNPYFINTLKDNPLVNDIYHQKNV